MGKSEELPIIMATFFMFFVCCKNTEFPLISIVEKNLFNTNIKASVNNLLICVKKMYICAMHNDLKRKTLK